MPSQSSNSNGGYSVTSSGTNSQVWHTCAQIRSINTSQSQAKPQSHPTLPNLTPQKPGTLFNLDEQKQGNSYDSRDYGSSASNQNSYHYSNSDGSYYYSNPNGKNGKILLLGPHLERRSSHSR
jgi:hypothetical protein